MQFQYIQLPRTPGAESVGFGALVVSSAGTLANRDFGVALTHSDFGAYFAGLFDRDRTALVQPAEQPSTADT